MKIKEIRELVARISLKYQDSNSGDEVVIDLLAVVWAFYELENHAHEDKRTEVSYVTRLIRKARNKRKKQRRRKYRKIYANFKAMKAKLQEKDKCIAELEAEIH